MDSPNAPAAVRGLIARLTETSWAIRRRVIAELAELGDAAVRPLCDLLRGRRDDERLLAASVDTLAASRGDVEPELMELVARDDRPAVLVDAIQVLGRRRSAESVSTLVRLTTHADDNVAMAAIEALGRIGGAAAVDSLVKILEGGNFFRAFPAIDVLGRSGDPRAVEPLVKALAEPLLAPEAVRALGRTGEAAAIAPLARLLGRGSEALVRVAALSLCDIYDRFAARYGTPERVEEAVRGVVDAGESSRSVTRTLSGADAAEQVALCRVLGWMDEGAIGSSLIPLLDADPTVAAAARQALRRLGRDADLQIAQELSRADSARRLVLLPHVGGRAVPLADVLLCLDDPDGSVRALACEALARIGNPAAARPLFARLADPDPRVAQSVVAAIQAIGAEETESLALEAARSSETAVRRAALRIIAYFGYPSALDILIQAMGDPDERLRDAAIHGLPFIDDPRAVDSLLGAAAHPAPRTRAAVVRALGQVGDDPRVETPLAVALRDADAWVRYYACQSLGKLGVESATEAIVSLTRDPAGQVRVAAVEALAHLRNEPAGKALLGAAASDEPDLRRAALVGLGIRKEEGSLPILLAAAEERDASIRLLAISALAGFASPKVLPALAAATGDWDESVREAAIGHLATRPGAPAARVLISLLASPTTRERAIQALAGPVEGRVDELVTALRDADGEQAPLLVAALARMHRPQSRAALLRALDLPSSAARRAAASALAAMRTTDALAALERAAAEDPDPDVRAICAAALGSR